MPTLDTKRLAAVCNRLHSNRSYFQRLSGVSRLHVAAVWRHSAESSCCTSNSSALPCRRAYILHLHAVRLCCLVAFASVGHYGSTHPCYCRRGDMAHFLALYSLLGIPGKLPEVLTHVHLPGAGH